MEESKDLLQQAKDIVNKDKKEIMLLTTKASVNGAVSGMIVGLMIGYYKGKNIYVSALVGGIIGGVASAIIVNKK